jgi:hypothetical protein
MAQKMLTNDGHEAEESSPQGNQLPGPVGEEDDVSKEKTTEADSLESLKLKLEEERANKMR